MKLKKLAQIMLVSCGILALGACSAKKHGAGANGSDASAMDAMNGGAQVSGVGEGQTFGDPGSSKALAAKGTYYFDFNKYDVRQEDKPAVLSKADTLVANPNHKVLLEGHTDPRGSREYNVALGENRANSVLELMKSRGVNPNQVRVVSYGAERPAVQGHSEEDFQLDRRAVIAKTQG
ncbi:MAG: OmpA family protein [Gammaproteobacteria bacterium]